LALGIWLAVPLGSLAGQTPRVVPMPQPPQGPKILRVTHDAPNRAVNPGATLKITVVAELAAAVTVSLGTAAREVPCSAGDGGGTFRCELIVPEGAIGPQRVRAQAVDAKGRISSLSAALPVNVEAALPWRETDALNVRLAPVLFAAGSTDLDAEARSAIAANMDLVRSHPQYPILLEGRCDAAEPGDPTALSTRRAEAVRDEMAARGVPPDRIRISGLAATEPLTASRDEAERAVNRSVLILLQPLPAPSKR